MSERPTFEETYQRHEFSELVRLGIQVGAWLLRMLRLARARHPTRPSADSVRHAD